jgi:hypothetical protein
VLLDPIKTLLANGILISRSAKYLDWQTLGTHQSIAHLEVTRTTSPVVIPVRVSPSIVIVVVPRPDREGIILFNKGRTGRAKRTLYDDFTVAGHIAE